MVLAPFDEDVPADGGVMYGDGGESKGDRSPGRGDEGDGASSSPPRPTGGGNGVGGAAAGGVKPRKIAGSIAGYVKAFTSIPSKAAKAWRQGTRTTGESLYIIQCTMVLEYQEEIPGAIHFLIYFVVSHEK
jgi:hypothetical protein